MSLNLNEYAASKKKNMTTALIEPNKGIVLTIDRIERKEYPAKGGGTESKLVVHWVEDKPPLPLNKGNLDFIRNELGPEEHNYAGRKVEVWHDPNVTMGGNRVGGLKLRPPRGSL